MEEILKKYPSLHRIYREIPLNKRKWYIEQVSKTEKINFVNEMNLKSVSHEDFFKNKKVAIIGPSPSIRNEENGDFIEENYDVIVRINKQWKHDPSLDKYIGKRTDMIYNCLDFSEECGGTMDVDYLKNNNIKMIVDPIQYLYDNKKQRDYYLFSGTYRLNMYTYFHLNNKNKIPFGMIDPIKYKVWDKCADTRINTGLLAIVDILHCDIKELYVKGFTFFKDGYVKDYRSSINNIEFIEKDSAQHVKKRLEQGRNHDQKKQWKFFKTLLQHDALRKKIKMDNALETIMNLENFDNDYSFQPHVH